MLIAPANGMIATMCWENPLRSIEIIQLARALYGKKLIILSTALLACATTLALDSAKNPQYQALTTIEVSPPIAGILMQNNQTVAVRSGDLDGGKTSEPGMVYFTRKKEFDGVHLALKSVSGNRDAARKLAKQAAHDFIMRTRKYEKAGVGTRIIGTIRVSKTSGPKSFERGLAAALAGIFFAAGAIGGLEKLRPAESAAPTKPLRPSAVK